MEKQLIINFLRQNTQLLAANDLDTLYKKFVPIPFKNRGFNADAADLTRLLLEAGVEPLDYLEEIPPFYLYDNNEIESVVIPSNIKTVGNSAFAQCVNLKNIIISNGVERIDPSAFYADKQIQNIILPDSVKIIGANAFEDCTLLARVTIGKGIMNIESGAFYNCTSLKRIDYTGTMEQWYNIQKTEYDDGWDAFTGEYTIHCTDGILEKEYHGEEY